MERLTGRRILVTGGGSGIGAATVRRCVAEGAAVAVCDKRPEGAEALVEELTAAGGRAVATPADVGDEAELAAAVDRAAEHLGGLDGVFANAGTASRGWIHELPLEEWEAIIRINLTGVFLTAKHTIPHLLDAGGGSFVATGSVASLIVGPGGSAVSYAASKGGVLQLTKQIAVDYGPQGIRANCLCPGEVATDLGRHAAEDHRSRNPESGGPSGERPPRAPWYVPMKRGSTPDEQAAVVAFLLSDDASFVTGTAAVADGGLTAI